MVYCFLEEGFGRDDFAKHILEVLFRHLQENDAVPDFKLNSLLPEIEDIESPLRRETFQRMLKKLLKTIDSQTRIVLVLDGVDKEVHSVCGTRRSRPYKQFTAQVRPDQMSYLKPRNL